MGLRKHETKLILVILVHKKDDTWRVCTNSYNQYYYKYKHPNPKLDDMLD